MAAEVAFEGISIWESVVLGIVEGITEYLPISSTGHLTITEKLLGMPIDDPAVTAYTAIIQIGAIAAAIIFFWKDIVTIVTAFVRGVFNAQARQDPHWRLACAVVVGCVPLGVAGLTLKPLIEGPFRSMWVVAGALIAWSAVMTFAEKAATHQRDERDVRLMDGLVIGVVQIFSLIPGVSRSGATISAGLLRDLDRVTATRLSFFLGIPALTAAGAFEGITANDEIAATVGWLPTIVGTVVSFVVAYVSIAWLLRYVSKNSIMVFVWYRIAIGILIIALLSTGVISAT
jgi:undecaprenyl-diphosphatase